MEPFGLDFGPPGEVKTLIFAATVVKIQGFRVFLKGFKKEAQKVPKGDLQEAKMPPRSAPGAPRSGPRGAKTAPGAARSAPREPQEPPKRRKKNKKGDHFRLRSPGGPGSHLGAILERFWSLRGGILEPFSKDFSLFEAIRCDRPRERRSKRSPSSKR